MSIEVGEIRCIILLGTETNEPILKTKAIQLIFVEASYSRVKMDGPDICRPVVDVLKSQECIYANPACNQRSTLGSECISV